MADNQRQERFRAIDDLARPRLIAFALRRTTTAEDAADIVAETFTIVWLCDSVPDGDSASWLFATARNVTANHYRRHKRGGGTCGAAWQRASICTVNDRPPAEDRCLQLS